MPFKEKRRNTPEIEQANQDRLTKRVVVYTLCGITWLIAATVCWKYLQGMDISQGMDRLLTGLIGFLCGMGFKTSVDVATKPSDIGQAVVAASKDEPIVTTEEK